MFHGSGGLSLARCSLSVGLYSMVKIVRRGAKKLCGEGAKSKIPLGRRYIELCSVVKGVRRGAKKQDSSRAEADWAV